SKGTRTSSPRRGRSRTEERKTSVAPLQRKKAAAVLENDGKRPWTKKAIREICVFLILFKVTLWIILASGVQPQLENGLQKQFFVFYRMHSVHIKSIH
uniref:Uncharacterized protein n=1 Tax=Mola mola TaxID=94237 RepID=A0A3Q3VSW9_MOLML